MTVGAACDPLPEGAQEKAGTVSDRVRKSDNARWGMRKIRPGGRVRWCGRWYALDTSREGTPKYDGRMDGMRGLFYTYGDLHEASKDHVYLHSVPSEPWPGPACVDGFFVWETFALADSGAPHAS